MSKHRVTLEVEIEDGVIPPGKELVRIGWPTIHEKYRNSQGGASTCLADQYPPGMPYVIVRDIEPPAVKLARQVVEDWGQSSCEPPRCKADDWVLLARQVIADHEAKEAQS